MDQVGDEGAGHFVKMVHNGIEYGDMQLCCEAYHLMKDVLGMSHDEMSKVRIRLLSLHDIVSSGLIPVIHRAAWFHWAGEHNSCCTF